VRAGTYALNLLSVPLNVHVLTALEEKSMQLVDLRRAVGSPPQTTMRGHLRMLTSLGVLERRRQPDFPGSVEYQLGAAGPDLLEVTHVLQAWLASSPDGPLQPGSAAAKSAISAMVEGWSSTIVRALAAKSLALTELSKLITNLSYPSLERRLVAMRLAGQIERCPSAGRGTPYAVTNWLRQATAPLAGAARWERKYLPDQTTPIRRIDIESAFLLVVPLLDLQGSHSGSCRLAVEIHNGTDEHRYAGVVVRVERGRIASCVSRLAGQAQGWASGSAAQWLGAVIERDANRLEIGGDCELVRDVLDGIHSVLPVRQRA
jgi:DNA-binding HxlR family transcriptional regulator